MAVFDSLTFFSVIAYVGRTYFSVNYRKLDFAGRKTISLTFFGRASIATTDCGLDHLALREVNGRQVRRVVVLFFSRMSSSSSKRHPAYI